MYCADERERNSGGILLSRTAGMLVLGKFRVALSEQRISVVVEDHSTLAKKPSCSLRRI